LGDPKDTFGFDNFFGYGRLNIPRALNLVYAWKYRSPIPVYSDWDWMDDQESWGEAFSEDFSW